jgi:hypothetical protein
VQPVFGLFVVGHFGWLGVGCCAMEELGRGEGMPTRLASSRGMIVEGRLSAPFKESRK